MDGQRETINTSRQPVRGLHIPVVPRGHIIHARSASYRRPEAFGESHPQDVPMMSVEDTAMQDVPNHWDLVENKTPEYIRRQREEIAAPRTPRINATRAFHGEPFVFSGPSRPRDITDHAGHRVGVYEHKKTRHVTFAPDVAPPRPFRAAGTPMFEVERCPTPFPLPPPVSEPGTAMYEVKRRPTPFPDLQALNVDQMPSQKDIEFEQRYADKYRDYQEQRLNEHRQQGARQLQGGQQGYTGGAQYHDVPQQTRRPGRPDGGIRIHSGPLPRHPDGSFKHPPLGWRPPAEIDERQMLIDEYGVVPWEDQTPYILAAADRRRGIDNPLRPTKPTWEQEDDSDDHGYRIKEKAEPRRVREWPEDDDGDDEDSVRQNRPEDYERPRGRRGRRGRDMVEHDNAPVNVPEEPTRPAISLHPGLNQAPLYGKLIVMNDRRTFRYHRTTRFNAWLETAANNRTPPEDFFHEWLRAKEAEDVQKNIPMKMPDFGPPRPSNVVPAQATADSPNTSSILPKEAAKYGKRGADSPEDEGRPSKRTRLASTFRRKLSLHSNGTNNGTTYSSGDTNMSVNKRRLSGLSGLDIFNVRSLSTLPGLSTLSRAASVGPKRVRIAIIGDSFAGKTTLLNRLYTGMYQPAEKSAHCRNNDFSMVIDGHPLILEAWDIPGQLPADETHPLNRSFFDAALICIAVDNMQNLNKALFWVNVLQSCLIVDIPLYLVGLKSDARPSFPMLRLPFMNEATPSSREQCEDVARTIGAVEYFECSAKTGEGVNEMFDTVIQHARSKKDEEELKRASHLRKEKLKRGVRKTGRRLSHLFCGPGKHV